MDYQRLNQLIDEVFCENTRQLVQYSQGDMTVVDHLIDCVMFKTMGTIESRRLVAELVRHKLKKDI